MIFGHDKRVLLISLFAGAGFWFLDAFLDYIFKSGQSSFLRVLIYDVPCHEFIIRPMAVLAFMCFGVTIIIFNRRAKENELRHSTLFENIQDALLVAYPVHGNDFTFCDANRQASVMLGYDKSELLRLPLSCIIDSNEWLWMLPRIRGCIEGDDPARFETAVRRKDGSRLNVEVIGRKTSLGGKMTFLWIIKDITDTKKTEYQLMRSEKQLRDLTARLMYAQEDERRRISVGLHDELGQALMHLKFKVSPLIKKCREFVPAPHNECNSVLSYMDEIIEYVRKLSRDLSPTVLEELGLTAALQYLLEEFSEHYKIKWNGVHIDEIDGLFQQPVQVNIFRTFQEILTNVVRHSLASTVTVTIKKDGGKVRFVVEDNGVGFQVDKVLAAAGAQGGIGIPSMQQRMRMIGGQLEILSRRGAGTRVSFEVSAQMGVQYETIVAIQNSGCGRPSPDTGDDKKEHQ